MAKQRIKPSELVLDNPLPWDVFDDTGALLLCQGYTINRESQREVLLARGVYMNDNLVSVQPRQPPDQRYQNPFRLWDHIIAELAALLRDMRIEKDFPTQIANLSRLIHQLAQRNADTALAAIILTDQRQYPIVHSIHVAVLCALVAQRLEWPAQRSESLVCGALTMNLAMLQLQQTLCTQRIAPTAAQRQEIQRHPQFAAELLQEVGVKDLLWLRAVREHHERMGGGGYPFGITTPSEEALLIQTVDIFTAKVSPRAARKPVSPQEAAKSLYLESGGGARNPFVAVLIKEVGIYPPGTFVALANGEISLVTRRGETANTPQVISLLDPQGMPYVVPVPRLTARKSFEVTAVIGRDQLKIRVDIEKIWRIS